MLHFIKHSAVEQPIIDKYMALRNQIDYKEIDYPIFRRQLTVNTYLSLLVGDGILLDIILNDDVEMLEKIAGRLDKEQLTELFISHLKKDGRTAIHLVASPATTTGQNCLRWIKGKIVDAENHAHWLTLLSVLDGDKDTPLHFAARRTDVEEVEIYLQGLTQAEIAAVMKAENKDGSSVLDVFFINYMTPMPAAEVAKRLKCCLGENWVELLASKSNSNKGSKGPVIGKLELYQERHKAIFDQIILSFNAAELAQFKLMTNGAYDELIDKIQLMQPATVVLISKSHEPQLPLQELRDLKTK